MRLDDSVQSAHAPVWCRKTLVPTIIEQTRQHQRSKIRYAPFDDFLEGFKMKKLGNNPWVTLLFGIVVGAAAVWLSPQQPLAAGTASSSEKFSMVTVPVEGISDTEAVFVLDHLTGILSGGRLNPQTGTFSHQYRHNIAADFQVPPGQKNPEYCIVSGSAQLNTRGNQPSRGAVYIAEKNSGVVAAYGFALPRGLGSEGALPMSRIHNFRFREGI